MSEKYSEGMTLNGVLSDLVKRSSNKNSYSKTEFTIAEEETLKALAEAVVNGQTSARTVVEAYLEAKAMNQRFAGIIPNKGGKVIQVKLSELVKEIKNERVSKV